MLHPTWILRKSGVTSLPEVSVRGDTSISDHHQSNVRYHVMTRDQARKMKIWEYYTWWIKTYKVGTISDVTMTKYNQSAKTLWKLVPDTTLADYDKNRQNLQRLFDLYGQTHRHLTCLDFKNQILSGLRSAVEDNFIDGLASSQIVITSREEHWSQEKRAAVFNQPKTMDAGEYKKFTVQIEIELERSLKEAPEIPTSHLQTKSGHGASVQAKLMALFILLHTGCRFAEALGVKFDDFHERPLTMSINKSWDYKRETGFMKTKNVSSIRDVSIDDAIVRMVGLFHKWKSHYYQDIDGLPVVVEPESHWYNDSMNSFFKNRQKMYGIDKNLTVHKIRHTYVSYLLNEGISDQVVADQVGHADTSMIHQVYGHIMAERQEADRLKIASLMK